MKITEFLTAEHTIYLGVFDQIERALPSLSTPSEVRTMASIIEGMLEGHAAREANLAYLALDHVLAEKGHLERMHQEHHEIDSRLKKVHAANTCAEARRLLQAALRASREHFHLEEKVVFPMMEKLLQPETLTALARSWITRSPELVESR
jgi:hemerythrin-like domain-containing protein